MKNKIKYIVFLTLTPLVFISCFDNNQEEKVNKAVENFYTFINNKDFENMKLNSTPLGRKYIEIIQSIGGNVVKIEKIEILETIVKGDSATVKVKTIDSFKKTFLTDWYLIRDDEHWKVDKLRGYEDEEFLTNKDIEYSKIDHVLNASRKNSKISDSL